MVLIMQLFGIPGGHELVRIAIQTARS